MATTTFLMIDGCGHYDTSTGLGRKWDVFGTVSFSNTSPRRTGIGHIRIGGSYDNECGVYIPTFYNTITFGAAVRLNASLTSGQYAGLFMVKTAGETRQVYCTISYGGKLRVGRQKPDNATDIIATESTGSIITGTWTYIEFKVYLANTSGRYAVYVNGVQKLNGYADTVYSGTEYLAAFVSLIGGQQQLDYTDIYIRGSTAFAGDFLGDCRVDTLRPLSDGGIIEFTPSTGTSNAACIDNTNEDDDTTCIYGATQKKDVYNFSRLPEIGVSTVYGLGITVAAKLRYSDTGSIKQLAAMCGSAVSTPTTILSTDRVLKQFLYTLAPFDVPVTWTVDYVNTFQYGVYVYA